MKFSLSVAALALLASQVMAVIPKNDPRCTKSQIVSLADTGCADFAARHGVSFDQLLQWNEKLSPKCDNLDVGHPICVSLSPGDGCSTCLRMPPINFANGTSGWDPASPYFPKDGSTPVPVPATSSVAVPSGAPSAASSAASSAVSTPSVPTASVSAPSTSPKATVPAVAPPANDAASSKASMMLAGAGVLLSIAYML
ncbi:hypothetical protein KVV02_000270 [Mortierella alpina]|uniref:LysM domain-containing protein n=1 Tax=Mortierella alpina TaxID=64518 RepID=A0A9P8D3G2_MORAP|nr:hypothetical protein KVV02_000270 [Mortierella alpina]